MIGKRKIVSYLVGSLGMIIVKSFKRKEILFRIIRKGMFLIIIWFGIFVFFLEFFCF